MRGVNIGKFCLSLVGCVVVMVLFHWSYFSETPHHTLNLKQSRPRVVLREKSRNRTFEVTTLNTVLDQYDLRIIVIVYNRANSMLRLLESLNRAEYGGDRIKLEVWIDRSRDGIINAQTYATAEKFVFQHGDYGVIAQREHVGIYGQWLNTWTPRANSSEIAVILEDDLTVSPYFYKYLKLVHNKYDAVPEVNGFSLQGISIQHGGNGNTKLQGPPDSIVFLYPVLGTWGFSPSTNNWLKFLDWFSVKQNDETFQPYVPGNVVTGWYKEFQRQDIFLIFTFFTYNVSSRALHLFLPVLAKSFYKCNYTNEFFVVTSERTSTPLW